MRTEKLDFRPSNKILRTYKHFPYKPWYAIAELVDNSTQSYRSNTEELDRVYALEGRTLEVRITYDPRAKTFAVWDNAMGMSKAELQHGILLAEPPLDRTGRSEFGMGMKTSCSWLGRVWSVETKKLGEDERFTVSVDIDSFGGIDDDHLDVNVREDEEESLHFTLITIKDLFHDFKGARLRKIKDYLVSMYREDIRAGKLVLTWDGTPLQPDEIKPLVVRDNGVERTWKRKVNFDVNGMNVHGFACILAKENRGRKYAGFDLLRRGRVIVGRPGGYRPEIIFGEARNDTKNQRLYGELHMDAFPVNHLKDDFLWESFQDEFDEKLTAQCADILDYLKTYKAGDEEEAISPEAQEAADESIADELSNDKMVELIEFLRRANPPEPQSPELLDAEANALRNVADSMKETSSGRFRIRIYHLKNTASERKYMTFISPQGECVDVFINDNHPFVHREIASDSAKYETYVKTCVYDALAEWIARAIPNTKPETISHFKDQLMRGPGFDAVHA